LSLMLFGSITVRQAGRRIANLERRGRVTIGGAERPNRLERKSQPRPETNQMEAADLEAWNEVLAAWVLTSTPSRTKLMPKRTPHDSGASPFRQHMQNQIKSPSSYPSHPRPYLTPYWKGTSDMPDIATYIIWMSQSVLVPNQVGESYAGRSGSVGWSVSDSVGTVNDRRR